METGHVAMIIRNRKPVKRPPFSAGNCNITCDYVLEKILDFAGGICKNFMRFETLPFVLTNYVDDGPLHEAPLLPPGFAGAFI